jgi:hypothetical protein
MEERGGTCPQLGTGATRQAIGGALKMQQRSALVHSEKLLLADRDGLALLDKQPFFGLSRYDGGAFSIRRNDVQRQRPSDRAAAALVVLWSILDWLMSI